jgi:hypothetical protein
MRRFIGGIDSPELCLYKAFRGAKASIYHFAEDLKGGDIVKPGKQVPDTSRCLRKVGYRKVLEPWLKSFTRPVMLSRFSSFACE